VIVYRLHSSRYEPNDGFGASICGGRWNSIGRKAIYTASSRALAVLEILVHYAVLPRDFVMTPVDTPAEVEIRELRPSYLKSSFSPGEIDIGSSQAVGDRLLNTFAVLRVPSVVIPEESNYVINPDHPELRFIKFLPPVLFRFDPRLKSTER
jgi:RES domain-containing protein